MARLPVPRQDAFTSEQRHTRLTARLGTWVGLCFGVCFVTGLYSHWYYLAGSWAVPPTRPVWGYRLTQGLHVASGTAAVPLLLVKLWSVYPRLFAQVPLGRARELVLHLLERASVAVLVASAIFQLVTGLCDVAQWYPWSFSFRATHYAVAWIAIGAILVHVAVKLPQVREAYAEPLPEHDHPHDPGRRALMRTALLGSAAAVLVTAGGTVPLLRRVSVLAVRDGEGPQGLPVNRSARAAGVTGDDVGASFRLTLSHAGRTRVLTREDLRAMRQRTHDLPIACVEGWSASATWTGVHLAELLDLVGAPRDRDVRVVSLQRHGAFGATHLPASFAHDPLTLLALEVDGEELDLDHGAPCRLIAPNRPGVMQTKWVTRLEVL